MKKIFTSIMFIAFVLMTNAQTAGTLTVKTTTLTYGGTHAPSHYLAIWVENGSGGFVKTLYASSKCQNVVDLTYWIGKNSAKNVIDAVTGATITSHGSVTVTWDGTNTATPRVQQPDGNYIVKMEMTENEGTGKLSTYTFAKGTTSSVGVISGTAATCFTTVSLQWVPTNTAIDVLKLEKQYVTYPNPTRSNVYVSGFDINEIEICTVAGKHIFTTNEQTLNLSSLPKGVYLAKINTKNGLFLKKIQKL